MEPLSGRGKVVVGVFGLIILVSLAAAWADLRLIQFIEDVQSGGLADEAEAEQLDEFQANTGIAQLTVYILCGITFLMWSHRAHRNLAAGGLDELKYTPGWAVGGWFVPFLNLVRPFQVMREVWGGSSALERGEDYSPWYARASGLVVAWWTVLLISSAAGRASGRMLLRAETIEEMLTAEQMTLASDLLDIPAAILALLVVQRVTRFQEEARFRIETDGERITT